MKHTVKIGAFFILVLLVVNISIVVLRHLDMEKRIVGEEHYTYATRIRDIRTEGYERAYNAYANYTADAVMLPMFYNLTTIHPFLLEQMPYLREYMSILVDNITVEFSDFQLIIMETNENMILVSLLNLNINLGLIFIEIEEGVKNIKKTLNS